jgi:TPR repeat protein
LLQLSGYGSGEDRVEANPEEAVKSFKDAYDKGYMPATYELGKYYYELNEHYLGLEKPNVASAKECFDTAKSYFEIALKHGIKIFHYDELTGLRPPNPNAGRIG